MGAMSNYLETAILNAVFRNTAFTSPSTVYLALYISDPTEADSGTEVTGGSYARQSVAFSAPTQVSNKATISNSADITFPIATANWGTVSHVGLRSASTGGNLLYYGPVTNARSILSNDQLKFLAGELVLDLD
ncbi:phage tail fiber protein [Paenibacillus sp. strain BS8-2]